VTTSVPRHVAIIMDGNGRWAQARGLPRHAGHKAGIRPVRMCVEACGERKIDVLTLFAFSSENWRRPADEIGRLMELFMESLANEIDELHRNGVRLRFIGDRRQLSVRLQARLNEAEDHTRDNRGLTLVVAVGYGGRWDIVRAAQALARRCLTGVSPPEAIDEAAFARELSLDGLPDPDLFIRTGGERRISNFLLWNLAYTELYFCDVLWPDFSGEDFQAALEYFAQRQRRFGMVPARAGSAS
jgi:undecaprenyl diphosphate synthase